MKRTLIVWTVLSAAVMILLPWLSLLLLRGDGDFMGMILMLFFIVDPLFSACAGLAAGKNVRQRWPIIFLSPVMYVAGAWLLLEWGEPDFFLYAAACLAVGAAAMLLRAVFRRLLHR